VSNLLFLGMVLPLDVVEVETVRVEHYLRGVIEEHPILTIAQFVAHAILCREVNELKQKLSARLAFLTVNQLINLE
jgi:hypothetical protein